MLIFFISAICFFALSGIIFLLSLPIFFGSNDNGVFILYVFPGDESIEYRLRSLRRIHGIFSKKSSVYIVDCGVKGELASILSLLSDEFGFTLTTPEKLPLHMREENGRVRCGLNRNMI